MAALSLGAVETLDEYQTRFDVGSPGGEVLDFLLPGQGEECPDCGQYIPQEFCTHRHPEGGVCGRPQIARRNCGGSRCPVGVERWLPDQAEGVARRIVGFDLHRALELGGISVPSEYDPLEALRVCHAVVSFREHQDPGESFTREDVKDARRQGREIAREAGFEGGALIVHPWRIKDVLKDDLRAEGYGVGSGGLWEGVRKDVLELGSWEAYLVDALHIHILGVVGERWTPDARLKPGDEVGGEEIFFKRLAGERGDPDSLEAVWRTARYLLTHAGVAEDFHAVSWWGSLAYNKWSPDHLSDAASFRLEELLGGLTGEEDKECDDCGGSRKSRFEPMYKAPGLLGTGEVVQNRVALERAHAVWKDGWAKVEGFCGDPEEKSEALDWLGLDPGGGGSG